MTNHLKQVKRNRYTSDEGKEKEFEDTKGVDRNRKSEDRKDHGQQNETKDKHRTHNTSLKTKAGVTRTLQKPG